MKHLNTLLALLLITVASATSSQVVEQPSSSPSGSSVPVVGNSPAQAPVVDSVAPVEAPQSPAGVVEQPAGVHQHQHQHQHSQVQPPVVGASYYSPASGVIQVVGSEQQVGGPKPGVAQVGRSVEQYGQPESASLPANYKPFGSWGLYIGGNPADGYYTNYYKALSNSVDQQQSGEPLKPTAALSPVLRRASSSPFLGGDYYPFAYSPSDLSSGARAAFEPSHVPVSPVQVGAQVYGAPSSYESNYHNQVSPYADSYATKRVGSAYTQQKEMSNVVQAPVAAAPSKGYQSRVYVYPPASTLSAPLGAPVAPASSMNAGQVHQAHQASHTQSQQAQVVAYPVPVGSQIVGSQQGIDGAFSPYGIHAFTRYAVKPTVVSQDASHYYGVQAVQQLPVYKQQVSYSPISVGQAGYYPLGFYGYPLSQLHYSQSSTVPQGHSESHQYHQQQAAPGYPFESSPAKAEEEQVSKPQQQ